MQSDCVCVCVDLNECHHKRDICEPNGLQCNNTFGSYLCHCKAGYENKDGKNKCTGQQSAHAAISSLSTALRCSVCRP